MGFFDRLFSKKNRKTTNQAHAEYKASPTLTEPLPEFLCYPKDPLSEKMFGSAMADVIDKRCGYRFKLYTGIADVVPEIRPQTPDFDINETHIFSKEGSDAWCSVSTMKTPSVKTSRLQNWVEANDQMGMMFGSMIPFLNLPARMENSRYTRKKFVYLGEYKEYNKEHSFDESHIYFHAFCLGDTIYKKFILCARRGIYAWKVECTIPSNTEALLPPDNIPFGQTFGSFFPS